jgi:hypothetical protein
MYFRRPKQDIQSAFDRAHASILNHDHRNPLRPQAELPVGPEPKRLQATNSNHLYSTVNYHSPLRRSIHSTLDTMLGLRTATRASQALPAFRNTATRRWASSGAEFHGAADNAFNRERAAVKQHAADTSGKWHEERAVGEGCWPVGGGLHCGWEEALGFGQKGAARRHARGGKSGRLRV